MTFRFSPPIFKYGDRYVDNTSLAISAGKSTQFLASRIGTLGVYEFSSEDFFFSAIRHCIEEVLDNNSLCKSQIGSIIVVGQSKLLSVIPHTASRVHQYCNFSEDCLCFDVGHGCAGFIVGLDIALSYAKSSSKSCLLVTADPYRSIVDPKDISTSLLFSDAVSVSVVGRLPVGFNTLNFRHFNHSNLWNSIYLNTNSTLQMNGRSILDFGKRIVTPILSEYIDSNFGSENVLVVPHHGSRAVVDSLERATPQSTEVLWDLEFCGNTISSSIPIVLSNCKERLRSSGKFVMVGFGVGLSTSLVTSEFND